MPSPTDGYEPFSQPGACVPQRRFGTLGILSPASSFPPLFRDSGRKEGGGVRVRVRGGGLVTGSLRCLIERESYPAALQGQKVLHKRCMNIKQNYVLASHTSTLADIFVSILF